VIVPDNATGNFVKIAQRIPVRISIDPDQALAARLRPGMSVVASIDTKAGGRVPSAPGRVGTVIQPPRLNDPTRTQPIPQPSPGQAG
jgi:hypothetical protein